MQSIRRPDEHSAGRRSPSHLSFTALRCHPFGWVAKFSSSRANIASSSGQSPAGAQLFAAFSAVALSLLSQRGRLPPAAEESSVGLRHISSHSFAVPWFPMVCQMESLKIVCGLPKNTVSAFNHCADHTCSLPLLLPAVPVRRTAGTGIHADCSPPRNLHSRVSASSPLMIEPAFTRSNGRTWGMPFLRRFRL